MSVEEWTILLLSLGFAANGLNVLVQSKHIRLLRRQRDFLERQLEKHHDVGLMHKHCAARTTVQFQRGVPCPACAEVD